MNGIVEIKTTTVVTIVTNNSLLRLGLQKIVDDEKWVRLVGHNCHAGNLDELLAKERPHIVILDTEIGVTTPEIIQTIKNMAPGIKTILLSGFDDTECTRQAFASGVDGIVLKVQPSAVLLATINYLSHTGGEVGAPISHSPAPLKLGHTPAITPPPPPSPAQAKWPDGLTEREREVVRLISEGLSNKDIADRLCISSITVRHHLTNIFDKLGVSNRQKLLIHAHQQGLAGPPALA
ncbi:MAG TPA: response regulator transcription factor [Nitrospira sp.]|nr:response regulator transcription factor [Nitrospira sp.]